MATESDVCCPADHPLVKLPEWVTDIHHHDNADEALPLAEVVIDEALPILPYFLRHLSVAKAGQVDQADARGDLKKIDVLRPARRLAGFGEFSLTRHIVDG